MFKLKSKKREAYITLKKVHFRREDWSTEHGYEYIDSFGIRINYGNSLHCLDGIDIWDSAEFIDILREPIAKKSKGFELNWGGSLIFIPKWAVKDIADQTYRYVGYKNRYWED